ncbi:MAG: class IV adenylate cyclase [Acidobacteriaceae bacterium]|nr:class IV adenylate cyclase [Acidobacteriaceae bacterium]MBV9780587.1 class IV adenylate cyclase [Acidobacteriaceae bacterium]
MKPAEETEVKIRLSDRNSVFDSLKRLGLGISVARQFESNALYDTDDQTLRRKSMLLRLRQVGDMSLITWKGPGASSAYKVRPELETSIGSLETFARILSQLGYHVTFRYEKYRTEFEDNKRVGTVTLDETPIGDFLELEGPGEWIDETARALGFSRKDYVLESYAGLYLEHCRRRGLEPSYMVFAS